MNILMMSNTYSPIVGGLEKSVQTFSEEYRKRGHRVIVAAPVFEGTPPVEEDVIRLPAIRNFNGTDFSVPVPAPGFLQEALKDFTPDIIHVHHPFFIGDTALRTAYQFNVPLIYTYHTMFEYNTHYVPGDSPAIKRFVIRLSVGFANLADHVFAPSGGIKTMLQRRGVKSPVTVVPTGIDLQRYSIGDRVRSRARFGVPSEAFVVGYAGRLAAEKNLEFLCRCVLLFLKRRKNACFLVAGGGPLEESIRDAFRSKGMEDRLIFTGVLEGDEIVDAYYAMDVFAFASQSETQGLCLVEAMAAGVPIVAVDAPGFHGLVENGRNGYILARASEAEFAAALERLASLPAEARRAMGLGARSTAALYSKELCADRALAVYETVRASGVRRRDRGAVWGDSAWSKTLLRPLSAQWKLIKNMTEAAAAAVKGGSGLM